MNPEKLQTLRKSFGWSYATFADRLTAIAGGKAYPTCNELTAIGEECIATPLIRDITLCTVSCLTVG